MPQNKLPILLLLVIFLGCIKASGQAARSPFSSFGYGDYYGDALVQSQGMAGTGVSNAQYWYMSNQNPALLAYSPYRAGDSYPTKPTVFQAGILGDNKRLYNNSIKGKSRNANLNYLTLGLPAMRDKSTGEIVWATAIGLMPYSSVNFNLVSVDTVNGVPVSYFDKAQGGFNQFYWSNGFRINKNLNVGLKTAVLFSSIISDYTNILVDPRQPAADRFIINTHEIQSVRGVKFTPAMSYRIDSIGKKYSFGFGATYEIKSNLSSKLEQVLERKDIRDNILQSDTITGIPGTVRFPQRLTAGASFGQSNKWMIASDFTWTSFLSNTVAIGRDRVPVQDGWKLSVGAELTPDYRSLSSYLKRVTYRVGASTEKGTYLVNSNAVKDFGINFGLSFPVNRFSSLDVAVRAGKRGDKVLNGIEENYFKIYFGVTFNDQWFIKRKFD